MMILLSIAKLAIQGSYMKSLFYKMYSSATEWLFLLVWCLSYFSIAVSKTHDQGNLRNKTFHWRLTVPEGESMTTMMGNMVTGRQSWPWSS